MKRINKLTLSALALPIAAVPAISITSCNKNGDISITGASYDKSKSNIELNKDSTIYLKPQSGKNITGIKSVTVGETVLIHLNYKLEFVSSNGNDCKLTIFGNCMKSTKISIEVLTSDISEISWVSYCGQTLTTNAILKPYTFEAKAKYSDGTTRDLAIGEYNIYYNNQDITDKVVTGDGYKLDTAGQYTFTFISTVNKTKKCDLKVTITAPTVENFEGVEDATLPAGECLVKLTTAGETAEYLSIPATIKIGDVTKTVVGIAEDGFAASTYIKQVEFEKRNLLRIIKPNAFKGCTSLNRFIVPENVTTIGASAFEGCTALTNVRFRDTSGNWTQTGVGTAITISSDETVNATNLKNVSTTGPNNWGYTGIEKAA